MHCPAETLLYAPELSPVTRWKKSCVPCFAAINAFVNAWLIKFATYSLFALDLCLPATCRFICCFVTLPTKLLLINKYFGSSHHNSELLSYWTGKRTLNLL